MKGADFAYGSPGSDGQAFKDAGLEFVIRYTPYPGDGGKSITAVEIADFQAHGIQIAVVCEKWASRTMEGFDAGHWDALEASMALEALGFPADQPIYFTVDWDVQPPEYALVGQYLQGCAAALGLRRVGIYGHDRILAYLFANGRATYYWQCLAWSGGRTFPHRHLYQYTPGTPFNGHLVDYDEAYADDFGQWRPDTLSLSDKQRLDRLESFFSAGIYPVVASDGNSAALESALGHPVQVGQVLRLTGEETLVYNQAQGNNFALGLLLTQQALRDVASELNEVAVWGSREGTAEIVAKLNAIVAGIDALDQNLDVLG